MISRLFPILIALVIAWPSVSFAFRAPLFGVANPSSADATGFTDTFTNQAELVWYFHTTNGADPVIPGFDVSTNNGVINIGTADEPTYIDTTADGTNNSYALDGVTEFFKTEASDVLLDATAFTLSCWFTSEAFFQANDGLIVNFDPSMASTGVLLRARSGGTDANFMEFRMRSSGGLSAGLVTNTVNVTVSGTWHHAAVTWRGSDGQTVMYIDGVEVERLATSAATGSMGLMDRQWEFGHDSGSGSRFWDGQIYRVVLYDFAMTAGQVQTLNDNTSPVRADNLQSENLP